MTYRSKELGLFSGKGTSSRRAIYKGCGYDDDDLSRPLIGIVNTGTTRGSDTRTSTVWRSAYAPEYCRRAARRSNSAQSRHAAPCR